jgi:hypothetical protein
MRERIITSLKDRFASPTTATEDHLVSDLSGDEAQDTWIINSRIGALDRVRF